MGVIRHNSIFDTDKVIDHYSKKDGVPIIYVCTTELDGVQNIPVDVFYRETPHREFGNRYFGLYRYMLPDVMITNADSVENLTLACVRDSKGDLHYSRYRHDCVTLDNGNMIDGGRAYDRTNNCEIFTYVVRNGIMVLHNETEVNDAWY
jgi:hypothetical protein